MLISLAVSAATPQAPVSEHLEQAKYLFIVEADNNQVVRVLECPAEAADIFCARTTIDQGCEAIICGDMSLAAYNLLADNLVTRYYAWGAGASQSVALMKDNRLQLIRESREGGHCKAEAHWQELQRSIDTVADKE